MSTLRLSLLALSPLFTACMATTHIVADKYDRPILVGPVRTLGGTAETHPRVDDFNLEIDNIKSTSVFVMALSSGTGAPPIGRADTPRTTFFGDALIDEAATAATGASKEYRVRLDEIVVGAYNFELIGFAYSRWNSWGRLRGQVVRVPSPPPPPASAEAPPAVSEPVAEPPPTKLPPKKARGKKRRQP